MRTTNINETAIFDRARVVLTVGVPGCGKSTLASALVAEHGFVQLELDQIRAELGDRQDMSLTMPAIALRDERLAQAVAAGQKVILSDTNAVAAFRRDLIERLMAMGVENLQIVVINFDLPVQVAKDRNLNREFPVPEAVIDRMAASLADAPPKSDYQYFWQRGLLGPDLYDFVG